MTDPKRIQIIVGKTYEEMVSRHDQSLAAFQEWWDTEPLSSKVKLRQAIDGDWEMLADDRVKEIILGMASILFLQQCIGTMPGKDV
jgi:hypothetical protein